MHACMHPSINGVPTNRPTNQATTWPSQPTKGRRVKKKGWVAHQQQTNQATKRFPQMLPILALHWQPANQPTNPATKTTQPCVFPSAVDTWFALRGRRRPLPPLFTQRLSILPSFLPSTHSSINQAQKQKNCISIKHCITQAITASKPSNQRTKKLHVLPLSMINPSLHVFSPNPSNQQAKQAEPTDTPTKGRRVQKKGWVAHQQQTNQATKRFPQMLSILALHW